MDDPAGSDQRQWRLKHANGGTYGPYSTSELRAFAREGRIRGDSLLAQEGAGDTWRPATSWPDLGLNGGSLTGVPDRAVPPFPDEPARRPVSDPAFAHAVYGLYALGGILPILPLVAAIVGVMIAYVRKDTAIGMELESHYDWQIRTFWWGLVFFLLSFITTPVLIGIPAMAVTWIWFTYRVIKGWVRLMKREPIDDPTGLI
ncbi:GYF domain-containing protein [Marinivivus vitaminiproducens]|uniref:GYF domain-containing protein n=1 Tax=Marinivivus vitaminiproducens TaxID=3035935 RepID=UPI002799C467|nr:GYF domain-containing protein [Geminicoccaceae bacterium SCSIO 64248]